jgi:hypothetical protein
VVKELRVFLLLNHVFVQVHELLQLLEKRVDHDDLLSAIVGKEFGHVLFCVSNVHHASEREENNTHEDVDKVFGNQEQQLHLPRELWLGLVSAFRH